MTRKKTGGSRPPAAAGSSSPGLPDRRLMEQQMAQIGRLLQSHDFASIEEANAFLQQMLATGGLPEAIPQTPLDAAQELIYLILGAHGQAAGDVGAQGIDAFQGLRRCVRSARRSDAQRGAASALRLYRRILQLTSAALGARLSLTRSI